MKKRSFMKNAMMLTFVNMIIQVVELYLGIYFSKVLGSDGVGIFQIMMSVFGLSATIGLGGFSIAVTRIVTRETELGSPKSAKSAVNKAILISFLTSGIVCLIMLLYSKSISINCVKDIRTSLPLKILALSMPFSAISICINSYFISVGRILTVSFIMLNNQFLTVVNVIFLINILPDTFTGKCIAITLAALITEIINLIIKLVFYIFPLSKGENKRKTKYGEIISISLPIGVSSCIRSFLNMLQNMLIPIGLMKFGCSNYEAMSTYGIIKGMAIPIVVFPASIMSSFLALLIPEISRSFETGNKNRINRAILKASSLTILFSIALTGILIAFGENMGNIAYDNPQVGMYIKILAPLVTFMFLDDVVDSALKGMNEQLNSLKFNIIESATRVVLLFILVPKIGVVGYVFVIFFGNILNFALSFNRLTKIADVYIDYKNWVIKPIFAIFLSCVMGKILLNANLLGANYKFSTIIAIAFSSLSFYILTSLMKCLNFKTVKSEIKN